NTPPRRRQSSKQRLAILSADENDVYKLLDETPRVDNADEMTADGQTTRAQQAVVHMAMRLLCSPYNCGLSDTLKHIEYFADTSIQPRPTRAHIDDWVEHANVELYKQQRPQDFARPMAADGKPRFVSIADATAAVAPIDWLVGDFVET